VVDAHVWVERQLRHYSQDDNIARRAEALQVMQRICQYANTEAQDELRVLVLAWWEATTPPQPMARPVVIPLSMVTENATRPRRGSAFLYSSLRTSTMDVAPYPSVAGPGPAGFTDGGWMGHVHPPKKKKARKPKVSAPKKEDMPSSSLPSATQPKRNLAYYGITLRPTEGEVVDDLPPILTNSDESSEDDFTEEVNQTILNCTAVLANTTSGADQVSVMTDPVEAQPAPEENPASPKVTPMDTLMEE
jgi:hypothetical protein